MSRFTQEMSIAEIEAELFKIAREITKPEVRLTQTEAVELNQAVENALERLNRAMGNI